MGILKAEVWKSTSSREQLFIQARGSHRLECFDEECGGLQYLTFQSFRKSLYSCPIFKKNYQVFSGRLKAAGEWWLDLNREWWLGFEMY